MTNFMLKVKPRSRLHLEPVRNSIKGWCEEDAIERANESVAMLTMHAVQTANDARAREERLFEEEMPQTTAENCLII